MVLSGPVDFMSRCKAISLWDGATPVVLMQATDVTSITDPVSGLTFEFALYKQFLQNVIHVRLAWGTKVVKEEHIATLIG